MLRSKSPVRPAYAVSRCLSSIPDWAILTATSLRMNSLLVSSCRNLLPDIVGSIANCGFAARLTILWRAWREGCADQMDTFTQARGPWPRSTQQPESWTGPPNVLPGKPVEENGSTAWGRLDPEQP